MEQSENRGIADLAEFFERWPELRGRIVALREGADLEDSDRVLLGWLIELVDRVGPADLDPRDHR